MFLKVDHSFCGLYPASSSMRTVGSFSVIKRRKREANNSPRSVNRLRMSETVTLRMPLRFVWWCLYVLLWIGIREVLRIWYLSQVRRTKLEQAIHHRLAFYSYLTFCMVSMDLYPSILIVIQRDAKQSSLFIILQVHSTCIYLPQTWPLATLEGGSCTKLWQVPDAVVTVLWTPDDGCGWHPKHVEWTRRIISRLLCVAFRWTVINIDQRCT